MAYDPTVPTAANDVRGALGDLTLMRTNFAILDKVATSGIHGLTSGGSAVSGAVVVTQAAGTASAFHYRLLNMEALDGVTQVGATAGQVLVSDGAGGWSPGNQTGTGGGGGGGALSGIVQLAKVSGDNQSLATGVPEIITGMVSKVNELSAAVNAASGIIQVPSGLTHARVVMSTRWAANNTGIRENKLLVNGVEQEVSWRPIIFHNTGAEPVIQVTATALFTVTGGESLQMLGRQDSGGGLNVEWGQVLAGGTPGFHTHFTLEGYTTSGSAGSAGVLALKGRTNVAAISGVDQTIANSTLTLVTGMEVTHDDMSVAFKSASGLVQVPSGVTYAKVSSRTRWAANSTGIRDSFLYYNGSAGPPDYGEGALLVDIGLPAPASPSAAVVPMNSHLFKVSGGDELGLFVLQSSGGNLDTIWGFGADLRNTWYAIEWWG